MRDNSKLARPSITAARVEGNHVMPSNPKPSSAPAPAPGRNEEPPFVDEPDLPEGEPSGEPTTRTKEKLPPHPGERDGTQETR